MKPRHSTQSIRKGCLWEQESVKETVVRKELKKVISEWWAYCQVVCACV